MKRKVGNRRTRHLVFGEKIGTGEDFLETLLETAVQLTTVFATVAKVYIAILDRLHFYSMT